jgi:uncharacterized protein with FMN-binding domain
MKKLLLSGFVILTFVIYSLQQRHETSPPIAVPAAATAQSSQNPQSPPPTTSQQVAQYKDGTYTGDAADAYYGNIQVQVDIKSGKITDVRFLQYPNDRANSVEINQQAMPALKQEAIQAQNAHVNTISGASDTSAAFVQSLSSALAKA